MVKTKQRDETIDMPGTAMVPVQNADVATLPGDGSGVDDSGVGGVPFVTFISSKSKKFPDALVANPGLKEPDAVLFRPAPYRPLRLPKLEFFFLPGARQYWVTQEDDGTITYAQKNRPEGRSALKEVVEASVLVLVGEKLIPARMTFKTTKCTAAAVATKAMKMAATPDWAEQSPAHAATLQVPAPSLRFTVVVTCTQKTARASGRKYWQADAAINPVGQERVLQLATALRDPDTIAALHAVNQSQARRVAEMEDMVSKSAA